MMASIIELPLTTMKGEKSTLTKTVDNGIYNVSGTFTNVGTINLGSKGKHSWYWHSQSCYLQQQCGWRNQYRPNK